MNSFSALILWIFIFVPSLVRSQTVPLDGTLIPFDQTAKGKEHIKQFGRPDAVDAFGYPVPVTPAKSQVSRYKKIKIKSLLKPVLKPGPKTLPLKKNPNVKSSFLRSVFDLFIPSSYAMDEDPGVPGLYHCRDSIAPSAGSQPGYFRAYFEDVAFNSNQGYDEPNLGYHRIEVVCEVLQEIATIIKLDQIMGVSPDFLFTQNWSYGEALAMGGSYFLPQYNQFVDNGLIHRHIISREDPTPLEGQFDGFVHTNWSYQFSVDSTLNSSTIDFKSVMRHEILHAMGFFSRIGPVINSTGTAIPHNTLDEFLYSPGNPFFNMSNPLTPLIQVPVGAPSSWFINNSVIYKGKKNLVSAQNDPDRPIYSPSSWSNSSLSHFDQNRLPLTSGINYVMHPTIGYGEYQLIHDHEKEVLCHLGYQAIGFNDCSAATPVANADTGAISGTNHCVNFLSNDIGYNGGDLRLYSLQVLSPLSWQLAYNPITYYTGVNCTGATTSYSLGSNIKSFSVLTTSTTVDLSSIRMKYQVWDSSSGRISQPAIINYNKCNVPADEYVCNGDFELGATSGYSAFLGQVPLWGAAVGSPDLVFKNQQGQPHNYMNFPYTTSNGIYVDMVDSGNFASVAFNYKNPPGSASDQFFENIKTELKAPLAVGQCYKVSFDAAMINTTSSSYQMLSDYRMYATLSTEDMVASGIVYNPSVDGGISVLDQLNPVTQNAGIIQWNNRSQYFSPAQAYKFLTIHSPRIPDGLNGNSSFFITTWVDNVSVKKVDGSYCFNNTISGTVYNDLNANSTMDLGESVIQNVQVGLFNSSTGALIDLSVTGTNGIYKFYSLPPSESYYVAIKNESVYQTITEPGTNSVLAGHQHTWVIPFANGVTVTGQNIGVVLAGQILQHTPITTSQGSCGNVILQTSYNGTGYTYNWTGPNNFTSTLASPSINTNGVYNVIVNGPNGFMASGSLNVNNQFPQIVAQVNASATNVSINTTLVGATATAYAWTGPSGYTSTQANATGITENGVYTVVASFGNNCTVQTSVNFQKTCAGAPPTTSYNTSLTPANNVPLFSCYATLTSSGGRECLYNISNPATTSEWNTGCPSTVAGANCCGWYDACPATTVSGVVTNSTTGTNGGVVLTVSGTGPYTYLWSNGQTTQNLTNVAPGVYAVTVKNANGCQVQSSFRVHSQMNVTLTKSQGCSVAQNAISSTVTGGAAPYSYRWYKNGVLYPSATAPETSANPVGMPAATYYAVVTDANGQQYQSQPVTIDAYTAPSIVVAKTDAPGTAYNNGSIKVTVSGGVAPYNFTFAGANPLTTGLISTNPYTRTGLSGSNDVTYAVSVVDSKNCSSNVVSGVKVLNKLSATSKVVPDCSTGTASPRVIVTPAGGHGGYTYQWLQGTTVLPNTSASMIVTPGVGYNVIVKDQSTPTQQAVTLSVSAASTPAQHSVTVAVTTTPAGSNTGSATVTATTGFGPYTYAFTPGPTVSNQASNVYTQTGLAAGNYNVNVTSAFGCSVPKGFTILQSTTTTK